MNEFTSLLQQGNAWFFIPSAILLGALHGLEPGHSKTMMAAFIIAIKGTVRQAVMLGLAATVSHTAIVWLIAFGGMYVSNKFTAQSAEPWLQLISAAIILTTALWMFWRTWRGEKNWLEGMQQNERHHQEGTRIIDTGHGTVSLSIFEQNTPPRWRLRTLSGRKWAAGEVRLVLNRGTESPPQSFDFVDKGEYLESIFTIPKPHNFALRLALSHRGHMHDYQMEFHGHEHHHAQNNHHQHEHHHVQNNHHQHEHHHVQNSHHQHEHGDTHEHAMLEGLDINSKAYQDAHELAHAQDIKRRFTGKNVTNGQILLFGLTGGLIPCPAAITVLLICIQLKALTLGATLVVCFSIGLALTLVTVGVGAALSVRHVAKRWSGFNSLARRAPYFSSLLIGAVGLYMGIHGYLGIFH